MTVCCCLLPVCLVYLGECNYDLAQTQVHLIDLSICASSNYAESPSAHLKFSPFSFFNFVLQSFDFIFFSC